ncbi:testis-specific Y-encoded-like protein 6 [Macaca thibetana thibetana]|uniref:testis-specific Y-encoded-like protein 6 n=1 Tax=Macaca thibetana thibetana TaxID=257877 RepID=UPI0021BCE8EF|nr:testis-specific Y-encoded-like protein 6 [Macaca thibetana thibetana]
MSLLESPHRPATPDRAPEDPHQGQRSREKSKATQVMADVFEGRLEPVVLPPPQLPEEGVAPQDPADSGRTFHILVDGSRSRGAIKAGQEVTLPPAEGLEAASISLTTDGSLKNGFPGEETPGLDGEKAVETCGAGRSESEVIAEGKAEDVKPEECAMLSAPVDEKLGGEEMDMAEGNRATDEVNKDAGPGPGPGPLNVGLHLNPLESIQLELDSVNAEADRALLQVERRFGQMHEYYLEQRNDIIRNIPGFWVTAFRHHPQLSAMIRGQDAEMLSYLTNLEVKELRHPRTGCKFKFFFRRNPYFRNKLIVKVYEVRSFGQVVSFSTLIMWRQGHGPQSFIHRNRHVICSFFAWFSDHSLPESDRIAQIIKEDLWPNPLQYYLLDEDAHRARRRPMREPVEIPRPFGFQSG